MNFKWWPIRRIVQLSVITLIASPLFGLTVFSGNLSAGELFGIELADPLAFLQATLASHLFVPSFFAAALIIAALYLATGGRSFCGWVCPVNLLTEMSDKLRRRLGIGEITFSLNGTRWALAATIITTAVTGIPLFETMSPIGITTRAILFRSLMPLLLVGAILIIEVCVSRRIWCRSLCPAGGFYTLLGRISPVRVAFNTERCSGCGHCLNVCPVEEVLSFPLEREEQQVTAGDCTRCLACIDGCPSKALKVDLFYK
jgi:ferredoxin-type protein NapH